MRDELGSFGVSRAKNFFHLFRTSSWRGWILLSLTECPLLHEQSDGHRNDVDHSEDGDHRS
jgi:hypothetical protein